MSGGKHLLLLAVLLLLERCQQKPQVSMSPKLEPLFSGDLFYLKCDDGTSGRPVNWYLNGAPTLTTTRYKIAAATQSHSGQYQCEISGEKSDPYDIQVLDFEPIASLTIRTGQPVMQTGGSVILRLQHQDGLQGWMCYVHKGNDEIKTIKLKNTNETSLDFQPRRLEVPETTYWCNHTEKSIRSNQITVRTSDKLVSLEMYPLPPVTGESLTLRCLTWGTDQISHAVFYKDNKSVSDGSKGVYKIPKVKATDAGRYKCHVRFTYANNPDRTLQELDSDAQDILVLDHLLQPKLTEDLHCSCESCQGESHSHWYRKSGQSWVYVDSTPLYLTPDRSGTYACKRVWSNKKSFMSNAVDFESPTPGIPVTVLVLILLLLIAVVAAVGIFIWRKKRNATGAIYEDVALRSRDKLGEDSEYVTLDPEAPNRKRGEKEGEYEPLKKEEMKEGEYQTLGMEHAAGGEGGYQALKKGGEKEVYHTLGAEGAAGGGEGGYQALKKGEGKEGVYHTLGAEGAAGGEGGGEGGYQALKKGGEKEVYHTLGAEGATGGEGGGEGGYQALKKEGRQEGVYRTLGTEGAAE